MEDEDGDGSSEMEAFDTKQKSRDYGDEGGNENKIGWEASENLGYGDGDEQESGPRNENEREREREDDWFLSVFSRVEREVFDSFKWVYSFKP